MAETSSDSEKKVTTVLTVISRFKCFVICLLTPIKKQKYVMILLIIRVKSLGSGNVIYII